MFVGVIILYFIFGGIKILSAGIRDYNLFLYYDNNHAEKVALSITQEDGDKLKYKTIIFDNIREIDVAMLKKAEAIKKIIYKSGTTKEHKKEIVKKIQRKLKVKEDGGWGPSTWKTFIKYCLNETENKLIFKIILDDVPGGTITITIINVVTALQEWHAKDNNTNLNARRIVLMYENQLPKDTTPEQVEKLIKNLEYITVSKSNLQGKLKKNFFKQLQKLGNPKSITINPDTYTNSVKESLENGNYPGLSGSDSPHQTNNELRANPNNITSQSLFPWVIVYFIIAGLIGWFIVLYTGIKREQNENYKNLKRRIDTIRNKHDFKYSKTASESKGISLSSTNESDNLLNKMQEMKSQSSLMQEQIGDQNDKYNQLDGDINTLANEFNKKLSDGEESMVNSLIELDNKIDGQLKAIENENNTNLKNLVKGSKTDLGKQQQFNLDKLNDFARKYNNDSLDLKNMKEIFQKWAIRVDGWEKTRADFGGVISNSNMNDKLGQNLKSVKLSQDSMDIVNKLLKFTNFISKVKSKYDLNKDPNLLIALSNIEPACQEIMSMAKLTKSNTLNLNLLLRTDSHGLKIIDKQLGDMIIELNELARDPDNWVRSRWKQLRGSRFANLWDILQESSTIMDNESLNEVLSTLELKRITPRNGEVYNDILHESVGYELDRNTDSNQILKTKKDGFQSISVNDNEVLRKAEVIISG